MSFNYCPLKDAPRMQALSADEDLVESSVIGVDPRSVNQPRNTVGKKNFSPGTGETRPADLVDAAALGLKGSKTLKALDKAVNLGSASQRARDIKEFLAKKAQAELDAASQPASAVPDPQFFERPDSAFSKGRRPKFSATQIPGIEKSFQPLGFMKAAEAAKRMIDAGGLNSMWRGVSGNQSPTGGLDEGRIISAPLSFGKSFF